MTRYKCFAFHFHKGWFIRSDCGHGSVLQHTSVQLLVWLVTDKSEQMILLYISLSVLLYVFLYLVGFIPE